MPILGSGTTLFDTHSNRIEEIISKSIMTMLPDVDPFFRNMIVTNRSVKGTDEFGRDWKVLRVFRGSLAGNIEGGGPRGDFPLYGDNNDSSVGPKIHTKSVDQTFPDPTKGANATPYRLGIPMRSIVTNLMLTLGEMNATSNAGFIGEVVAPKLTGFGRYLSQVLALYAYLSQNNNYALTTIADPSTDLGTSGTYYFEQSGSGGYDTLVLDLKETNYAIDRFMVGMRVSFYSATDEELYAPAGATSNTVFMVTYVDELQGIVKFMCETPAALATAAATQANVTMETVTTNTDLADDTGNVHIVLAGTYGSGQAYSSGYFTGIAGINSFLKDGSGGNNNYILGDERDTNNTIDVTVHPEFKSFSKSLGGSALSEHLMRRIIRRIHAARRKHGKGFDTLLASDGVWSAYEATKIGREILDRTGRVSHLSNEGSANESEIDPGFSFTVDGRTYKGYTSSYVESGTVYGLKLRDNWCVHVPPEKAGLRGGMKEAPAYVPFRFAAPALTGTNSSRMPITTTASGGGIGLLTEGTQMPGWLRLQCVPKEMGGEMRLSDVAEDRIYSDN